AGTRHFSPSCPPFSSTRNVPSPILSKGLFSGASNDLPPTHQRASSIAVFSSRHRTGIAPKATPTVGRKQKLCVTHCYARLYRVPPEGTEHPAESSDKPGLGGKSGAECGAVGGDSEISDRE